MRYKLSVVVLVLALPMLLLTASIKAHEVRQSKAIQPVTALWSAAQATPASAFAAEFPFVNAIKSAPQLWQNGAGRSYPDNVADPAFDPSDFDTNGYPTYHANASSFGGWFTYANIPEQYQRPGHYVVTWTGAGDFSAKENPSMAGGNVNLVSCIGTGTNGSFNSECTNEACNARGEMRGYIVGDVLNVSVAPAEPGCALKIGQPISGVGIKVTKFGTPTIITGDVSSVATACNGMRCSGTGGAGTYRVNFFQEVGSRENQLAINPGGRWEVKISGEKANSGDAGWVNVARFILYLNSTGTASDRTNTAQNIALLFHCNATAGGSCIPGDRFDDEEVYWTGQIVSPVWKAVMQDNMGVIRDLGLANNLDTNTTTWASRSLASYWSWVAPEMRNSIYAGSHGGNPIQAPPLKISFTGSLSGTTLNASNLNGGALRPGVYLDAAHVEATIDNGAGGAGNVLTVTKVADGTVSLGESLYDVQGVIASSTVVTGSASNAAMCGSSLCTGDGGTGTYLLSGGAQRVSSTQLYRSHTGTDVINLTIPGAVPYTMITDDLGGGAYALSRAENTMGPRAMSLFIGRFYVKMDSAPPADKETIILKWPVSTGDPSTNYFSADGGKTYRPICQKGGSVNTEKATPVANLVQTVVYDAQLSCWMLWSGVYSAMWGQLAPQGLTGMIPPEVFVELAHEIHAQPWVTAPFMATDPVTDFFTQYALYVKNNYPDVVPGFETPDETWAANAANVPNDYGRILTTFYRRTGDTAWLASRFLGETEDWTGKIASTMCQAVGKVFNYDTSKYRCIEGEGTNQDYNNQGALDERIKSIAYVHQDKTRLPIQSGCAGPGTGPLAVDQMDCPTPFTATPAYDWVTNLAVFTYWGLGEQGANSSDAYWLINGYGVQGATQQEVMDAYSYMHGSPLQQSAIMRSYLATATNRFVQFTPAQFASTIYPPFYTYLQSVTSSGCAAGAPCHIDGLLGYEGGYSAPHISRDIDLTVTSAAGTAGKSCKLNTTISATGYINDGKGFSFFDRTPGNFFSYTGNLPFDPVGGTMINVPGQPVILGYWTSNVTNDKRGYGISTSLYLPTTSVTIGSNGAVSGMPVKITDASGGSWPTVNGRTFIVGPDTTQAAIPLTTDGATPFDCSGLGALSSLKMTYVGSADYINFLRDSSYASPQIESVQKAFYGSFYTFGGGGASQLNVADVWGSPWRAMGDDMEGYMTLAACTACSISNGVLTLGGTVNGRFQVGATITGANQPGGSASVAITDYLSGDGTKAGDRLRLSAGSINIANLPLRSTVHYPPGQFPLIKAMHVFNVEHAAGGHLKGDVRGGLER